MEAGHKPVAGRRCARGISVHGPFPHLFRGDRASGEVRQSAALQAGRGVCVGVRVVHCVQRLGSVMFWFRGGEFHVPTAVYAIALPFGIMNAIGGIVFMAGVRFGKISTSWLIINLSAAIPAVGSVVLYHEPVNARKLGVLALAALAVLLLWKDKQEDEKKRTGDEPAPEEVA